MSRKLLRAGSWRRKRTSPVWPCCVCNACQISNARRWMPLGRRLARAYWKRSSTSIQMVAGKSDDLVQQRFACGDAAAVFGSESEAAIECACREPADVRRQNDIGEV